MAMIWGTCRQCNRNCNLLSGQNTTFCITELLSPGASPIFGKPAVVLSVFTFKHQMLKFPRRGCIEAWTLAGVFSGKVPHSHQALSEVLSVDEASLKRWDERVLADIFFFPLYCKMLCTKVEHMVTGLEELAFVFCLLEICAILRPNLNSTCHRHGGHLLRSGRSQWSYTDVNPKLLHVWPDLAEAASKANYLFPHTVMKSPCSHRRNDDGALPDTSGSLGCAHL